MDLRGAGVSVLEAAIVWLRRSDDVVRLEVELQDDGAEVEVRVLDKLFPEFIRATAPVGRPAEEAAPYYASLGLTTNLLRELGENLAPGSAALVVVVGEPWVATVEEAFGSATARVALPNDLAASSK
jgi:hypothetical protein